ncbi:ribonuclease P protein component [Marinovum algicola]|jgi:ribonuclease P protein component|uniref:ribonuclease P protein component n=1 Tax=Marinovum algicola TaxID=42444 RepID=UPI0024BA48CE|nr:ribonuclease P protein component [Marinovum algicola]
MTPPEAPELGSDASRGTHAPAVLSCPELRVLKKRAAFLAAARARRQGTGGFLLQARRRGDDDAAIGVGFTCSKKVGNAVVRNRAKRRLREIARLILPEFGQPGWDYVLIGKAEATAARDFTDLQNDLRYALRKVHGGGR